MAAWREILAHFGVTVDVKDIKKGNDKVEELIGGLKKLGGAVAGAFVYQQVKDFAHSVWSAADELGTAAEIAGMSAGELQRLRHAADMLDVSAETLGVGIRMLQRNFSEAKKGSKDAAAAFTDLGISLTDSAPPDTLDILTKTSDKIRGMTDPIEQTALAMKVFGRSGTQLLPMLKAGGEKIAEYAAQVEELGGGFSQQFIELSDEFDRHEKQLGMLKRSISAQLVGLALPGLLKFGHYVEKAGKWLLKANQNGELLRLTLYAFSTVALMNLPQIVTALRAMNWQLVLGAAKVAILVLALDELITWFRGGEGYISDFFASFAPGVNTAAADLGDFLDIVTDGWDQFVAGLSVVPSAIGMAATLAVNETTQAVGTAIAWVVDQWDSLIRMLRLPGWAETLLMSSNGQRDKSGTGNQREQSAAWDRSREQIGSRFQSELDNGAWGEIQTRIKSKREQAETRKGWGKSDGQMGEFGWDMLLDAPSRVRAASAPVPESLARSIQTTDNSVHNVNVTVPGTTPANVAQKTANAVSRATRNENRGALGGLEHVIER